MRRIAVFSSKGGSAKTTTAVHLAAGLAQLSARALLVDLDPAARASRWIGKPDGGEFYTALEALAQGDGGKLAPLVRETATPGLDLLPSSLHLRQVEQQLGSVPGAAKCLAEGFHGLPRRRWDVIVLDLAGANSFLSTVGLAAADAVVVPIEGAVDLDDLPDLKRTVELVRRRLNPRLSIEGVLLVRADRRTRLHRDLRAYLESDPALSSVLLSTVIRADVRMREAPSTGQTIFSYAPRSGSAADYRQLAAELGRRLEITP